MRFASFLSGTYASPALLLLLLTLTPSVRCFPSLTAARNVLRAVSADDRNWYPILASRVKVTQDDLDASALNGMLQDDGTIATHEAVRRLASGPGATGTQTLFAVRTLGTALSCQLAGTLLVHMFFTAVYASREHATSAAVRACVSKVQVAAAKYVDKVAAFDQPVDAFLELNRIVNEAFARVDAEAAAEDDEQLKAVYSEALQTASEVLRELLGQRCGTAEEEKIVETLRVSEYNAEVFEDHTSVEDHQLLAMIESLDEYEYVDFEAMGLDFWMRTLEIHEYSLPVDEELTEGSEDD